MGSQETIIKPEIIQWARERTGLSDQDFARRMHVSESRVKEWESGQSSLTFPQAQKLASLSLLPFGVLFLNKIPNRDLHLPDFRTINNDPLGKPSPELEATVLEMQKKQDWLRVFLLENDASELSWVNSLSIHNPIQDSVRKIRQVLKVTDDDNGSCMNDWEQYFSSLILKMEDAGITVIRNGIVGNNTHRSLDPNEFRGFVLVDSIAPLIFINGKDDKNPQMFTLIHELVHLFLGQSGIIGSYDDTSNAIERYCNKVSAEFLVPDKQLRKHWSLFSNDIPLETVIKKMSNIFKVSSYVIIWKCKDAGLISKQDASQLWDFYKEQYALRRKNKSNGGDFYASLKYRVGQNFAKVVISELADHNISYSEAFDLLQVRSIQNIKKLSEEVGFPVL